MTQIKRAKSKKLPIFLLFCIASVVVFVAFSKGSPLFDFAFSDDRKKLDELCIDQLGQIDGVKEIWALENKGTAGTVIPESEKNTISVF